MKSYENIIILSKDDVRSLLNKVLLGGNLNDEKSFRILKLENGGHRIIFQNVVFSGDFSFCSDDFSNYFFQFISCEFKQNLMVDLFSKIGGIELCKNCIIREQFNVWNNSILGNLLINQGFNINWISISSNSNIDSLVINGENIPDEKIPAINEIKYFDITDSTFNKEFSISRVNILENFSISKNIFNCRVRISKDKYNFDNDNWNFIKKFIFKENTLNDSLRVGHSSFEEFEINNLKILQNNELNLGEIIIEPKGFFRIENLRNFGRFKLYNLNFKCFPVGSFPVFFNINNSSLGYVEFQNINFNYFQKVILYANTIKELLISSVDWPKEICLENIENSLKCNESLDLKETYRLLKVQMLNQKDIVSSLFFFSKEMEEYSRILKWKRRNFRYTLAWKNKLFFLNFKKKSFIWKLRFFLNLKNEILFLKMCWEFFTFKFTDRFVLCFNRISNNYGQNWFLPLIYIFGLNLIFFILFAFYVGFDMSWKSFGNGLGYFAQFLIPTNSVKDIFPNLDFNGVWESFNIFKNIIISVLLYQTIMAFRKYSKK